MEKENNCPALQVIFQHVEDYEMEGIVIWKMSDGFYSVNDIVIGLKQGEKSAKPTYHTRLILTKKATISYIMLEVMRIGYLNLNLDIHLFRNWGKDIHGSPNRESIAYYHYSEHTPNWNENDWRKIPSVKKSKPVRQEIKCGIKNMLNLFDGAEMFERIIPE